MFTIGVHTQIISEDSVPRNQHIRGFVLLLFALSCLRYCLCVSFEPQVIPAFFLTIYARLPPHFATSQLAIQTTFRYFSHHQVYFEDLWELFSPQSPPPPSLFEEPLSPP